MLKQDEICVLLPTRKRPLALKRVLTSLSETAPAVSIVVIYDPDDVKSAELANFENDRRMMEEAGPIRGKIYTVKALEPKMGCVAAWNAGLAAYPNFGAYIIGADDLVFYPGWLQATILGLKELNGSGLVGFNDGHKDGNLRTATHYLMTRDFIIENMGGCAVVPAYTGEMTDLEAKKRAVKVNKFYWAENAHVLHDWHGGPLGDETSRIAWERRAGNKNIYKEREKAGFPDDFLPVLVDESKPVVEKKGKGRRAKRSKPAKG